MASVQTFGGSNTYGIGDPEAGGYAARLRNTMIGRMMNPVDWERGVVVDNRARLGMTLPQIVERLPASLADRNGRGRLIAVAMVGFSDSAILPGQTEPSAPLKKFCDALMQFTVTCNITSYPVHRIFIESPPVDLARPHPRNAGDISPARTAEYQLAVKRHAEETGAVFIETHSALHHLPQDPLSEDGIHPSAAGHRAIHDLLLPQVDALLEP